MQKPPVQQPTPVVSASEPGEFTRLLKSQPATPGAGVAHFRHPRIPPPAEPGEFTRVLRAQSSGPNSSLLHHRRRRLRESSRDCCRNQSNPRSGAPAEASATDGLTACQLGARRFTRMLESLWPEAADRFRKGTSRIEMFPSTPGGVSNQPGEFSVMLESPFSAKVSGPAVVAPPRQAPQPGMPRAPFSVSRRSRNHRLPRSRARASSLKCSRPPRRPRSRTGPSETRQAKAVGRPPIPKKKTNYPADGPNYPRRHPVDRNSGVHQS